MGSDRRRFLGTGLAIVLSPSMRLGAEAAVQSLQKVSSSRTNIPRERHVPKIILRQVIWSITPVNPLSDKYTFAHSPTILRMPDDRLLTAWWALYLRGGCVLGAYSADGGETWGKAETLSDANDIGHANEAMLRDGNRVWLFYNLSLGYYAIPALGLKIVPSEGGEGGSQDCYYRYTDDGGKIWTQSRLLDRGSSLRANGIRLASGELLLGAYDQHASWVLKSSDRGKNWRRCGQVVTESTGLYEPCLLELQDGRILMYLRADDGYIWKAISGDKGDSWSKPERTAIQQSGHPADLLRLRDGTVTLCYDASNEQKRLVSRTTLSLRFSRDDCATWSEPLIIEQQPDPLPEYVSIGYPSIAENAAGDIVVVYYHKVQQKHSESGTTQIKMVKVKL